MTIITTTAYGGPREVTSQTTNPTKVLVCCKRSDFNNKFTIYNGGNITAITPLPNKKPTTTDGAKVTEEQWKVETKTKFNTGNNVNCRRRHITKTEIISSPPDAELSNIQKIDKGKRNSAQFIRRKTKKDVSEGNGRGQRGRAEEERLKPGENTLG